LKVPLEMKVRLKNTKKSSFSTGNEGIKNEEKT